MNKLYDGMRVLKAQTEGDGAMPIGNAPPVQTGEPACTCQSNNSWIHAEDCAKAKYLIANSKRTPIQSLRDRALAAGPYEPCPECQWIDGHDPKCQRDLAMGFKTANGEPLKADRSNAISFSTIANPRDWLTPEQEAMFKAINATPLRINMISPRAERPDAWIRWNIRGEEFKEEAPDFVLPGMSNAIAPLPALAEVRAAMDRIDWLSESAKVTPEMWAMVAKGQRTGGTELAPARPWGKPQMHLWPQWQALQEQMNRRAAHFVEALSKQPPAAFKMTMRKPGSFWLDELATMDKDRPLAVAKTLDEKLEHLVDEGDITEFDAVQIKTLAGPKPLSDAYQARRDALDRAIEAADGRHEPAPETVARAKQFQEFLTGT